LTTEASARGDGAKDIANDYHKTYLKLDNPTCGQTPQWTVDVPPGVYQVDTLYAAQFQSMWGCSLQGQPAYEPGYRNTGFSDMSWVSMRVNTTGQIQFQGGNAKGCSSISALVIYPVSTLVSTTYCQTLEGMCCPLFVDMANRPCSSFQPPCMM